MAVRLNVEQINHLHIWLEEKGFESNKLAQTFADGCELARLLKLLYPRLVDLQNYFPRQSTILKINNWSTLNNKVLSKLKLFQTRDKIEAFANEKNGAIELLLFKIMQLDLISRCHESPASNTKTNSDNNNINSNSNNNINKNIEIDHSHDDVYIEQPIIEEELLEDNGDILRIKVKETFKGGVVIKEKKLVIYSLYEDVINDIKMKRNLLGALNHRISQLEGRLELKNDRIKELRQKLDDQIQTQTETLAKTPLKIQIRNINEKQEQQQPKK